MYRLINYIFLFIILSSFKTKKKKYISPKSLLSGSKLERRKLLPPKLKKENIKLKISCYRPVRKTGPAMYVENRNNKVIAHNYGHGGGGWSLAPGAAKYVIDKLDLEIKARHLSKNEPIVVIGAGIIGLFSVYELIKKGYTNITIVAEDFSELPSNHAGGLWSPFHIGDISAMKDLVLQIGINSYKFFADIAKGKNDDFKFCAKFMPAYFKEKNRDLELFVGSVLKPAKQVLADFGNGNTKKMYVYDDIMIINTPLTITKLTNKLMNNSVKYVKKTLNSFQELEEKIIVNCSGYGSKKLCNDKNMVSVQGHLLVLKNQNPKSLNYLLTVPIEEGFINGYKVKRLFYIIPRHDPGTPESSIGVIGGTLIEGVEKDVINAEEFNKIIERAKKFYGIKK
ncbi:MAG: FAD-binding oxidoreductase [Bacteroidetes bacterium]|nr:FAD-binding oxidoreductase [Bacteroidota bacterium]